jgi:hypothetical protein
MSLESDGGMILTGEKRRTLRKTCPSATLPTTNPTWIDPGTNPGLRGERPATNDLSHGTALTEGYYCVYLGYNALELEGRRERETEATEPIRSCLVYATIMCQKISDASHLVCQKPATKNVVCCPQITSWSLRGVNVLSAVRGSTEHAGGRKTSYWSAIKRHSDS